MAAAAVQYPTSQNGQMIQVSTAHLGTNEIRVGQRRSEAYVRLAEQAFLHHDEIVLCGLGNSESISFDLCVTRYSRSNRRQLCRDHQV